MDSTQIEAALASRHRPGATLKRLRTAGGLVATFRGRALPAGVRAFAEQMLGEQKNARLYWLNQNDDRIAPLFAELADEDRRRLSAALLPGFDAAAEAAWQALARRPYQRGMSRLPFRSRSAAMQAHTRGRWLLETGALLGDYEGDLAWVAAWAPHVAPWMGADELGWLLAGALDAGGEPGDAVMAVLDATMDGSHPVGQTGRHLVRALLGSARPDAWARAERLLLAAQRQEGLRQVILESVDEAHPDAFRRMIRLIREENLARFSSVVRALDVWFGFQWAGGSGGAVDSTLDRISLFLDDAAARDAALGESDGETVYLALWSAAFEDVDAAVAAAARLLSAPAAEARYAAANLLARANVSTAPPLLAGALDDADLRVAARALDAFATDMTKWVDGAALFDALERLAGRIPARKQALEPLVWPWTGGTLERTRVAASMAANAAAVPAARLIPHVRDMAPYGRESFVRRVSGLPSRWSRDEAMRAVRRTPEVDALLLDLLGDASADVREAAFAAADRVPIGEAEAARLVDLLSRKPGDLRTAALRRLRRLDDRALLAAADRLTGDAEPLRRLAGLELLRDAFESTRAADAVRARMRGYRAEHPEAPETERAHLDAVLGEAADVATLDDALGLAPGASERGWPAPARRRAATETPAARAAAESLAALVLAHAETPVTGPSGEAALLVETGPFLPVPRSPAHAAEAEARLPLVETWKAWLKDRAAATRDGDGLELLRVLAAHPRGPVWAGPSVRALAGVTQWNRGLSFLQAILEWCAYWQAPAGAADFLADGMEDALADLTAGDLRAMRAADPLRITYLDRQAGKEPAYVARIEGAERWSTQFDRWRAARPEEVPAHAAVRVYRLRRWLRRESGGFESLSVTLADVAAAWRAGAMDPPDFHSLLLETGSERGYLSLLRVLSARTPPAEVERTPALLDLMDACRRRIVEVECARGDRPTAASRHAVMLRWSGGLDTLSRALPALGPTHFSRSAGWGRSGPPSRQESLSHLVLRSIPRAEDTPEAFAAWAAGATLKEARLVELAVYAPQWARHVAAFLGWEGLESAVWWMGAHTKDDRSWDLQELKEAWAAEVSEHTPLSAADLTEGAVDVAWFRAAHGAMGAARWKVLEAAAKYGSAAGGHTRARLFAQAMAGGVTRAELEERIGGSRHQDSVRALGLVPLPEDAAEEILARYRLLQEFRRGSRAFGSQRQQSEARAVEIGMANLARTAGYRDPQRLQWAMEAEAVADLAAGPVVREVDGVTLTLSLDADGSPSLAVRRGDKALKSIPGSLSKDPVAVEMKERVREIRRQHSRVRLALEEAMVRGDAFTGAEVRGLMAHPVLRGAVERLVFAGDDYAGFPVEGGFALRDAGGAVRPLGGDEPVRIAHPADLLRRGDWPDWQRDCFRAERVQPFKQVFRELYPRVESEIAATVTRRYAGHQVQPRQALALLGGRGWVAQPEEGVSRTFHEAGITARLTFQEAFYTPADVEGLTLEGVIFTRKGAWEALPLGEVEERAFSEAMRDLDLAVSVAHQGGVDPEATASTMEMRAALLRETCALLGLENVEVRATHAFVRGERAEYAVHLGSASATVLPGTALYLVAVHSQHRGRLFLPFADDDPRTAEVMAKVLLLARDREIRDPNLLDQIRLATRTTP